MKEKDELYIKILQWAYERRATGFTKDELRTDIGLSIPEQQWPWVDWMFFNALNGAAPLAWIMGGEFAADGETHHDRYYLTAAGTSAMFDYLELKHAREESNKANKRAFYSMLLGTVALVVGFVSAWQQIKSNTFTQESLEFTKQEIAKANDPFFIFSYSSETESFKLNWPNEIHVESVEWYLQDVIERDGMDVGEKRFFLIDTSPSLTRNEIEEHLLEQMIDRNPDLKNNQAKYFIHCYDYQFIYDHTLKVLVTIYYQRRGSKEVEIEDKFLYLDNIFEKFPEISQIDNINNPDVNKQFFSYGEFINYLELPKKINWETLSLPMYESDTNKDLICEEIFPGEKIQSYGFRGVVR